MEECRSRILARNELNSLPQLKLLSRAEYRQFRRLPQPTVTEQSRVWRIQQHLRSFGRPELCLDPAKLSKFPKNTNSSQLPARNNLYDSVKQAGLATMQWRTRHERQVLTTDVISSYKASVRMMPSRLSLSVMRANCMTIQLAARRWTSRLEMLERLKLRRLQAEREQQSMVKHAVGRERAVMQAQSLIRRKLIRIALDWRFNSVAASKTLQHFLRKRVAMRVLVRLQKEKLQLLSAVILMQCRARGNRTRAHFAIIGASLSAAKVIGHSETRSTYVRHNFQINGAVLLIQHHWRGRMCHRQAKFRRIYLRNHSANIIRRAILCFGAYSRRCERYAKHENVSLPAHCTRKYLLFCVFRL